MKYHRTLNERKMVVFVVQTADILDPVVSSRILPYPAVSCHICRMLRYPAVSCRILRIVPYPAVSCRILPYPAVSCRIVPYRIRVTGKPHYRCYRLGHFLNVHFVSIDPQHFVDGSTSSPGYLVIGENPGLFKFWSLSRSFQIITSIPESKSTLETFQLTPSRLFAHPEKIMNFTLFGSSKAADDGLSTLFKYSPSHLFQNHQAPNSPLQTRFPSRRLEAVEGKIFDTR